MRKQKLQGHFVRSRSKWIEQGEKPTKYFLNLEFRNFLNKTIKRVELEGKQTIYNQSSILNYVKEYCEILYTSINSDITNIDLEEIINCEIPKLKPKDSTSLDKEISEREVL